MHERALRHSLASGELEERAQVVDVRVDAAVGDEAEQVDVAAPLPAQLEGARSASFSWKAPVLDGAVQADEILVDDPARADRQVADLGVPHLAVRQPDRRGRTRRASCADSAPRGRRRPASPRARRRSPAPGGAHPQPSRMTSVTTGYGLRSRTPRRTTRDRARRPRSGHRRRRAGRGAPPHCPASPSRRR